MKRFIVILYLNCVFFNGVLSNVRLNRQSYFDFTTTTQTQPTVSSFNHGQPNIWPRWQPTAEGAFKNKRNFSFVCSPEVFHHDYIVHEGEVHAVKSIWNSAKPNESATLDVICLKPNGLPVMRKCLFDPQIGAFWEPIDNWNRTTCIHKTQERIITHHLLEMENTLSMERSAVFSLEKQQDVVRNVLAVLQKPKSTFLPADVLYTTQILAKVFESGANAAFSQDVVAICDTFMSIDDKILQLSAEVNTTNIFLNKFEDYLNGLRKQLVPSSNCGVHSTASTHKDYSGKVTERTKTIETNDFSHIGVYAHLAVNVSVFFINPKCANVTGIAVYGPKSKNSKLRSKIYESQGNYFYRFVYSNESATELMAEPDIQVATFLPESLWKSVKQRLPKDDQFIVLKVYAHDSFFVDLGNVKTCRPSSKIISISLPGFKGTFPESLPFLIRNNYYDPLAKNPYPDGTGCGYWTYETWSRDGISTASLTNLHGPVVLCSTKHLTQFSFLLGGSYKSNDISDDVLITPIHQQALNIISLVGSSLSLLGLLGIWITALLFKSWRCLSSTKVLLNMCLALTLQMILFLFVNTDHLAKKLIDEESYMQCIALGALMQYSLLVLFTWMLLVAFLQFQRYVTVLGVQRPSHFILKAALTAWLVPLIPTIIVVFVDPEGYLPIVTDNVGSTCYPSGYGLTFGIILPVTLICIANLTIFIYVFYSISHTLNQSMQRQEKLMLVKQIRLSILLFFLLGLCWIFGLLEYMNESLIFSYLFCLTATLQGFVLFLYFVVFNDNARNAWIYLLCPQKLKKPKNKMQEMQSITASTGVDSMSERP